ncbi:MAG: hypothetical protein LBE17_03350, partial [Treponema sp.]|nr:hypothetical protein [Treponema sp.]
MNFQTRVLNFQTEVLNFQTGVLNFQTGVLNFQTGVLNFQTWVLNFQTSFLKVTDQGLASKNRDPAAPDLDSFFYFHCKEGNMADWLPKREQDLVDLCQKWAAV